MAYHCWWPGGQMLLLLITAPAHLELVAAASARRLAALVADGFAQWPGRVPAAWRGRRWPLGKQERLWGLPHAPWGTGHGTFCARCGGAHCPRPELGLQEGSGKQCLALVGVWTPCCLRALGEANPVGSKPP